MPSPRSNITANTVAAALGDLARAAKEGRLDIVEELLALGVDIAVTNADGCNALWLACYNGSHAIIERPDDLPSTTRATVSWAMSRVRGQSGGQETVADMASKPPGATATWMRWGMRATSAACSRSAPAPGNSRSARGGALTAAARGGCAAPR